MIKDCKENPTSQRKRRKKKIIFLYNKFLKSHQNKKSSYIKKRQCKEETKENAWQYIKI